MSTLSPVAFYGLQVPPTGTLISAAQGDIPGAGASYRITMAAIDPTEAPEADEEGNIPNIPRSTLKIVRGSMAEELDEEYLEMLRSAYPLDDSDESDEDDDDEPNGGPSDPAKSKKAKQAAAVKMLLAAAEEEDSDSDEDMADVKPDVKPNGVAVAKTSKKGKEPATSSDDEDDESISEIEMEEYVVCTLDTERNYQQPLDITISPGEKVSFFVTGTHSVYLTGNYMIDMDNASDSEDDEEDDEDMYDFPDALEEMYGDDDESEDDELDGLADPRIKELDSDEEEAPKLVEASSKKGKNKRPAAEEEETETLDSMIAKDGAAEIKLSKKQQKKLKNNKGEAVEIEKKTVEVKETTPKSDKKVQFAKNLEQGPTGSAAAEKEKDKKGATGVKVVQGVTVDDRKAGSGRAVKKGNKVGVRYIGKLDSGKVFDSNKKGKPFSFTVGAGEVIKGWDIGIMGMSVGGERRLTIPAHLAYGSKPPPGIPVNAALTFDIKLLEIK